MAETWGRRWITCDSSRIAIALAKQRLMTASYDYFVLAHPDEGLKSGFKYKDVPWVTLKGLANKQEARIEPIVDQPLKEPSKVRVCGPFTVEAVPSLRTKPFGDSPCEVIDPNRPSHSGETAKYRQWMDELKVTGVRGMGGRRIEFSRIEPSTATRFVHATGELFDDKGINRLAAVCFGPDFGPLEQRQVEQAVTEVRSFRTKPDFLIFCAFQFDPEAAKDIEEIDLSGIRVLKVQMTADLLTADLRKRRSSNESFWLIGQPDIDLKKDKHGRCIVRLNGFDYYNPATGEITSGGADKIAMWMLDTNYDDRSLLPEQVFFPQADDKRDWTRLAKSLNGLIDEDKLEAFVGVESLPFTAGENRKIAVKIIDDRGIESFVIKKI
jgi:adenine-specific DNA-methyltransferase